MTTKTLLMCRSAQDFHAGKGGEKFRCSNTGCSHHLVHESMGEFCDVDFIHDSECHCLPITDLRIHAKLKKGQLHVYKKSP